MALPVRVNISATATWTTASSATYDAPALPVTAGNALIVMVSGGFGPTVTQITDTAGNTYVKVSHFIEAQNFRQELWYAKNIIAHAANVVTVTWTSAVQYRGIAVVQYSGLFSLAPFDAFAQGTAAGTSTTVTTGVLNATYTDTVHVLMARWGTPGNITYPVGFSANITGNSNALVSEKFVTSPYTGTYTVTHSDTSTPKAVLVAVFGSTPPTTVTVPNVVGMTEAAATSALVSVGLVKGTVLKDRSVTVPAGSVISQNPTAGSVGVTGSVVDLVVSLGAVPIPTIAASSAGRGLGTTSLTVSHTVPAGTDRYLLVLCNISSAFTSVTGTYGGVALVKISDVDCAVGANGPGRLVVFGLANPTVGTANVVLSAVGGNLTLTASVSTLTDCTYVAPLVVTEGNSAAPSLPVTNSGGALIVDLCGAALNGMTFTPGAGQIAITTQNGIADTNRRLATSSKQGTSSATTMSWTLSVSGDWIYGAVRAYKTAPAPDFRVSQDVIEVLTQPQSALRVSQDAIEVLNQPQSALRVSQSVVEVLTGGNLGTPTTPMLVSQVAAEVMFLPPAPPVNVSQVAVEVMVETPSLTPLCVSQVAIEVMVLPGQAVAGGLTGIWMGDSGGMIWVE